MSTMSSEDLERLRKLQMADLGTARREYISTVEDPKKLSRARLEDIEATRQSNIAGTAEARLAKKNQARLEEWSNLYKTIGNKGPLEGLEDIMSGQSHRANLDAAVQAAGGQKYSSGQGKGNNGTKRHHPNPVISFGRGGGVIGTRGRGSLSSPPRPARPEQHAATQHPFPSAPQRLDPALDINNDCVPQRGRGAYRGHGKRSHGRKEETSPRVSRGVPARVNRPNPVMDPSRNLSTPEAFMATARQKFRISPAASNAPSSPKSRATSIADQRLERPKPTHRPQIVNPFGFGPVSTPVVTETPVSKLPVSGVSDTPTPPPRLPKAPEAAAINIRPVPVSQPFSAETKTPVSTKLDVSSPIKAQKSGPAPVRFTVPNTAAAKPQVPRECLQKLEGHQRSGDAGKKDSSCVLLDIDAPEEASGTGLKRVTMSPGCADLTGLDFSSASEARFVSAPSTPLVQSQSQSPAVNASVQRMPMLRKLVDTTRLTQQLIEQVTDVRDSVASSIASALEEMQKQVQIPAVEHESTPQPSSPGRSLVEDWLSQTSADQILSLDRAVIETSKNSFLEYRSPANTSSSTKSAQQHSPRTLALTLSPRNSVASEGMTGFEALRVSESPVKPISQGLMVFPTATSSATGSKAASSAAQARAANSLAQSIHAGPWPLCHRLGEAKVIGARPSFSKEQQDRLVTEYEGVGAVHESTSALATRHVAGSWTTTSSIDSQKPRSSAAPPTQPLGLPSFAPRSQSPRIAPSPVEGPRPVAGRGSASAAPPALPPFAPSKPTSRVRIEPPPPVSRGPVGAKVIGVAPYMPNYPVLRTSTGDEKPNTNRAASVQAASSTSSTQRSHQAPSVAVIGPKPFVPSIRNNRAVSEAQKPFQSVFQTFAPGSSNVSRVSTASTGFKFTPSPLSQYPSISTYASMQAQEQPSDHPSASHQASSQASTQAENKPPPKWRVFDPPANIKRT